MVRRGTHGPDGGAARDVAPGRELYAEQRWSDAYDALSRADRAAPLECGDLEALAWCAALTGRDQQFLAALERLYHTHHDAGRDAAAARAAFWLGFRLFSLGEGGRAAGWLGRSARAVECKGGDCVERGYLMLPTIHRHLSTGDHDSAHDVAAEAAAIGDRFGDRDLVAFARNLQGRALMRRGEVREGLALVDEAMVSVAGGEVSPLVAGLVYCTVIASCQQVYALDRSREWTDALSEWCKRQPQLVTFTGVCMVHRAEILQLGGAWTEAAAEARRARERSDQKVDPDAAGEACYQQAEIHRLRGESSEAEEAYRCVSSYGREPQPGLALLRLAQGRADAACASLRRVLGAATTPLARARFLPALVEVALAVGDTGQARAAADELGQIAGRFATEVLDAIAAHARGAVLLAVGEAQAAVEPLRRSFEIWRRIGAPYLAARIRVLLGTASGELGDVDGRRLELDAARQVFRELGAVTDLARLDALERPASGEPTCGLTPRELEVIRLVAGGGTNKAIARELGVSERTVDWHVSNIFAKLDVSSRAAATAFAYEHELV